MAHVRQIRAGKWKADVQRGRARSSRTFETEAEAREWATNRERTLDERKELKDALQNEVLLSHLPRRVLEAALAIPYSKAEVLKRPLPMVRSGIYFLIAGDEIIYVGQSVDVYHRVARHRREGKEFDAFNIISCAPDRLNALEALYINALAPWLNHTLGARALDCISED